MGSIGYVRSIDVVWPPHHFFGDVVDLAITMIPDTCRIDEQHVINNKGAKIVNEPDWVCAHPAEVVSASL
ncbi:hypothetical protein PanWU01x14_024760, partial [Parasponia andersonii]